MARRTQTLGAELLREHRRRAGLTQRELARRSGVSERAIRGIESGTITAPYPATLDALARGIDLSEEATDALVRSWTLGGPERPFASYLVANGIDAERVLLDVRVDTETRTVIRSVSSHTVIAANGMLREVRYELLIEALRDGIDSFMRLMSGDPGTSALLLELDETSGCELLRRVVVPDHDLVAFELSLGVPVAAGETRVIRYRITQPVTCPDDPDLADAWRRLAPTDRTLWGSRRSMGGQTQQVSFHPRYLPSRVWEVRGDGLAEVRELTLDPFGTAHIHISAAPPGVYGIMWAWE